MGSVGASNFNSELLNKFNAYKADNNLDKQELKDIIEYVKNNKLSESEIKEIVSEIYKDKVVDNDEKKFLLALGYGSCYGNDSNAVNLVAKTEKDFSPNNTAVSELFEKGFGKAKAQNSPGAVVVGENNNNFEANPDYKKTHEEKIDLAAEQFANNTALFTDASQKTNCIKNVFESVNIIKPGDDKTEIPEKITTKSLEKITGEKWKEMNFNDLDKLKESANDKDQRKDFKDAVAVIGNHTYKVVGLEAGGKIHLEDPSEKDKDGSNKEMTISLDDLGPSFKIFTKSKTDDNNTSEKMDVKKTIDKDFNKATEPKTFSDKQDKTGESFEIRKLLSLLGNPNDKESFEKIARFVNDNDVKGLQNFLKENNINLDESELQAFITKMTTKLENGSTMIEEMKKLNDKTKVSEGTGINLNALGTGKSWTDSKKNYQVAVQFSEISLKDFFTTTSAEDLYKSFQLMQQGKEGC